MGAYPSQYWRVLTAFSWARILPYSWLFRTPSNLHACIMHEADLPRRLLACLRLCVLCSAGALRIL